MTLRVPTVEEPKIELGPMVRPAMLRVEPKLVAPAACKVPEALRAPATCRPAPIELEAWEIKPAGRVSNPVKLSELMFAVPRFAIEMLPVPMLAVAIVELFTVVVVKVVVAEKIFSPAKV